MSYAAPSHPHWCQGKNNSLFKGLTKGLGITQPHFMAEEEGPLWGKSTPDGERTVMFQQPLWW